MVNNEFWLAHIADDEQRHRPLPRPRQRKQPEYCLPSRLPPTSFLNRESDQHAEAALRAYKERLAADSEQATPRSPDSPTGSLRRKQSDTTRSKAGKTAKVMPWKDPEPFEVYRAVERKDLVYLMEVRDRAFHLLLRRTQNSTPLLHALRIGQSHRDVAIILVGAFSRWINHLEDEDFKQTRTRDLLKALRANLKLAIDFGLQNSQSDLVASFMQALVMSEGEKWVHNQVSLLAIALRAPPSEGRPVETATKAVRAFATKELGRAEAIAALDDYMSNAILDLVVLGAWSLVRESVPGLDPIPAYYFARDDRVYKAFLDRLREHQTALKTGVRSRRLRWQLETLEEMLAGRTTTLRSKVEALAEVLDHDQP
ncbi:hypothetical protein EXIGLDRAFT_10097 [Exidia glandulosa HHB12029]|uniref:Uncharacterized protein n=1 Tax=Exidia glandulosa HHB12029 TaxID=1314781 RepID=A0A165QRL4_EXIGL|nr:hypothetical protein EXIGLDRAFT_10097 [Exidia glandulosa HHB12029]